MALGIVEWAILCPPTVANRRILIYRDCADGATRPTLVGVDVKSGFERSDSVGVAVCLDIDVDSFVVGENHYWISGFEFMRSAVGFYATVDKAYEIFGAEGALHQTTGLTEEIAQYLHSTTRTHACGGLSHYGEHLCLGLAGAELSNWSQDGGVRRMTRT